MKNIDIKVFNGIAGLLAESITDWYEEDARFDSNQIPLG